MGVTRIQMSTPGMSTPGNKMVEWETSTDDFESVLICALRYCLGRQTYMPSIIIAFVRPKYCPHSEKERLMKMYRRYHNMGRNHLSESYEQDIIGLPEDPPTSALRLNGDVQQ